MSRATVAWAERGESHHRALMFLVLAALAGCSSRPARVAPPAIDPAAAGQAAIVQYDADGDGLLGGAELDRVPALKQSLTEIDRGGDGKISAEEIAARIAQWQETKVGAISVTCTVTRSGTPLSGAKVTFVPEEFLGAEIKAAEGESGPSGIAVIRVPQSAVAGIAPGFYRIKVSKSGAGGAETVPARYNQQTTLGMEASPNSSQRRGGVELDLRF